MPGASTTAENPRAHGSKSGAGARCRCGRRWTSLVQCHCPTCHRQFSGVSGFDQHRVRANGDPSLRICADPATMTNRKGEPVFAESPEASGVVWRLGGHDSRFDRGHGVTNQRRVTP